MKLETQAILNTDDLTCIMFDMDNTLFDFVEAKTRACQEIVDHLGCGDAAASKTGTIYGTIFWTWVYSHDLRMMNAVRYTKQRN